MKSRGRKVRPETKKKDWECENENGKDVNLIYALKEKHNKKKGFFFLFIVILESFVVRLTDVSDGIKFIAFCWCKESKGFSKREMKGIFLTLYRYFDDRDHIEMRFVSEIMQAFYLKKLRARYISNSNEKCLHCKTDEPNGRIEMIKMIYFSFDDCHILNDNN